MKTKAFLLLTLSICLLTYPLFSQSSAGFNYQAVVRNASGTMLANQNVGFRFSILQGSSSGTVVFSETHDLNTDGQGIVNLIIGNGSLVSGSFTDIDWNAGPYYLKVELDPLGGTSYILTETKRIQPVAYALFSEISDSITPGRLEVKGDASQNDEEALFVVKRNDGQTVFAVYPDGVRVYVEDLPGKGSKSGFAVGGFNPAKGLTGEFLRVTPDSVRVYVADDVTKGKKGGFAVGGYNPVKGAGDEYFRVTGDSVRIYIQEGQTKGTKGGFAVGGYNPVKGLTGDYFNVSGKNDAEVINGEARVMWYPLKEAFRAGNVLIESKDSVGTNSWASGYQSKAIGDWSQALGYKAIARGDYSTAIGKYTIAGKMNSFAFGDSAITSNKQTYAFGFRTIASGLGSMAIGYRAKAIGQDAFALGSGTEATGQGSFAIGFIGRDSAGVATGNTKAEANWAVAIGMGAQGKHQGAFSIGTQTSAEGEYSLALGYKTKAINYCSTSLGYKTNASGISSTAFGGITQASGPYSTAMGYQTVANDYYSIAMGYLSTASGPYSLAAGDWTTADGLAATSLGAGTKALGNVSTAMGSSTIAFATYSTAMGINTYADSYGSLVIGQYNIRNYGGEYSWRPSDPLFEIGNGTSSSSRSNALTVLKNGNVGIGTLSPPVYKLDVNGDIRASGNIYVSGGIGIGTTSPLVALDVNGGLRLRYGGSPPALSGGNFFIGWNYTGGNGETDFFQHGELGEGGYEFWSQRSNRGRTLFAHITGEGDLNIRGTFGSLSDERSKTNIRPIQDGLNKILNLKGVYFQWRDSSAQDNITHLGLIAQDVLTVVPELVTVGPQTNGKDKLYSLNYDGTIPLLIEAIKEQQNIIVGQKTRIDQLERQVSELNELKIAVQHLQESVEVMAKKE